MRSGKAGSNKGSRLARTLSRATAATAGFDLDGPFGATSRYNVKMNRAKNPVFATGGVLGKERPLSNGRPAARGGKVVPSEIRPLR